MGSFAGVSRDEVFANPIVLVGRETEMVERLHERRERWGYTYTWVPGPMLRELAGVVARG
jgi:hypothetical protein